MGMKDPAWMNCGTLAKENHKRQVLPSKMTYSDYRLTRVQGLLGDWSSCTLDSSTSSVPGGSKFPQGCGVSISAGQWFIQSPVKAQPHPENLTFCHSCTHSNAPSLVLTFEVLKSLTQLRTCGFATAPTSPSPWL